MFGESEQYVEGAVFPQLSHEPMLYVGEATSSNE